VVSVTNLTDEDPPFARLDLNYDPFTHNGIGRTVKFSLTKRF
jgi:iron complex outermembrane recepter protein